MSGLDFSPICPVCHRLPREWSRDLVPGPTSTRYECVCGCSWYDPPKVEPLTPKAPRHDYAEEKLYDEGRRKADAAAFDPSKAPVTLEQLHKILDEREKKLHSQISAQLSENCNNFGAELSDAITRWRLHL